MSAGIGLALATEIRDVLVFGNHSEYRSRLHVLFGLFQPRHLEIRRRLVHVANRNHPRPLEEPYG